MIIKFGKWTPPNGTPPPGGAGIAFEQELDQNSGAATVSLTIPGGGVPEDNTVIVAVWDLWTGEGLVGTGSLSDSRGNTYSLAAAIYPQGEEDPDHPGFKGNLLIYRARLDTALQAGDTITYVPTGNSASSLVDMAAAEFSDLATTVDDAEEAYNASNAGTLNTTHDDDLLVAAVAMDGSGTITAGAGWTNLTGIGSLDWMYRIVSSSGAYTTPFTTAEHHAAAALALQGS